MERANLKASLIAVATVLCAASLAYPQLYGEDILPPNVFLRLAPHIPTPVLQVTAERTHSGWVLLLDTENWTFSDLCAQEKKGQLVGHAHIYLNDQKIGTTYLPIFYLDHLPKGEHTISVSLRATDHRIIVTNSGTILAHTTITQS